MCRNNYYHFLILTLPILRVTGKLLIANTQYFHVLNDHKVPFFKKLFFPLHYLVSAPLNLCPQPGELKISKRIYIFILMKPVAK